MNSLKVFVAAAGLLVLTAGTWNTHLIDMEMAESKVVADEKKIRELADEIRETRDKKEIQVLTKAIIQTHETMVKDAKRADKLRHHMRFEHPEKGKEFDAKYPRSSAGRVADLDQELGLDKVLNHMVNDVKQKFPTKDSPDDKTKDDDKTKESGMKESGNDKKTK